jgi:biopolymer transport protein ExbD
MRLAKKRTEGIQEGDLTPMIDMTFQLIAFFMVLINFSQVERSEDILLPASLLAKPPQEPPDAQVLLNLRKNGNVIIAGKEYDSFNFLKTLLDREVESANRRDVEAKDVVVVIRSHKDTPMRRVQALISKCQESGLETFSLRVMEQRGGTG